MNLLVCLVENRIPVNVQPQCYNQFVTLTAVLQQICSTGAAFDLPTQHDTTRVVARMGEVH